MDQKVGGDAKKIIEELVQGLELARELQMQLHVASTSHETRELLIQRIISAFEKALEMVSWKGKGGPIMPSSLLAVGSEPSSSHHHHHHHLISSPLVGIRMSDESPPLSASPRSEDSDRDFARSDLQQDQTPSRKRKTLPRWTKQVRVNPGMGVEGPLDDGYSWRKYGQKDILGAMYPRGYYRCTHRNVQGCLATKQVQRSDEDPTVFEITYRGKHTCTVVASSSNAVPNSATTSPTENNQESNSFNATIPHNNNNNNVLQSLDQQPINELLLNLREGLRVQTENLDAPPDPHHQHFATSLYPSNIKTESQVFPPPPHPMLAENNNFNNSPSYVSPATSSGISHFSVSPSGIMPNLATSGGSQIKDIISASNSPTVPLDFPFDHFEFDGHHFTFDNPRFFS